MTSKHGKNRTESRSCCPTHQAADLTDRLAERFLAIAREESPGGCDSVAMVLACELVKRAVIDAQEGAYAKAGDARGLEAFRADLASELAGIVKLPNPESH